MVIIIDSTHFKQDRGLNKENISLIKDLGRESLIKLHIPWFVYQECSSSCISDLITELNTIKNTLRSFDRKGMYKTEFEEAKKISQQIHDLINKTKKSNEDLWNKFIVDSKSILHKFDEKDSINVFESYFNGAKPFKSLKNRNDIPDAFIYTTIKKISNKSLVHLISGDKNLTEKCSEENNIKVYETFEDFYKTPEFKKIEKKYNQLKQNQKIQDAINIIIDNKESFEDAVKEYCNNVNNLEFFDENLASDNGEAMIYAIDEPEVEIEENEIKFFDNKFFVPITVKALASMDYAVFKADYWAMDSLPTYSEDLNKHYFLIEDTLEIVMKKIITIDLEEVNEDEILEIEIDEFDEISIDFKNK